MTMNERRPGIRRRVTRSQRRSATVVAVVAAVVVSAIVFYVNQSHTMASSLTPRASPVGGFE